MDDDIGCCSAYFYSRYTDEDTLIDLSMMSYPYPDNKDDCLLPHADQSWRARLRTRIEGHWCWSVLAIIVFLLIILLIVTYLYSSLPAHIKLINLSSGESTITP